MLFAFFRGKNLRKRTKLSQKVIRNTRKADTEDFPAYSVRVPFVCFVCFVVADFAPGLFALAAYFFKNGLNKSIGTGKNVVVLCSLEISRMVCRKRSWSAIGSLLIIAAAWTIFSAA